MSDDKKTDDHVDDVRTVFTSGFAEILERLNISLLITTYQAGKVAIIRNDSGTVNTHIRPFEKPMGVALQGEKLAIGGLKSVTELRNIPVAADRLTPLGKYDACYLPRRTHVTGDIDVHEMAYDGDGELWVVNTGFCCLCTLDAEHSFTPRWQPSFVSEIVPEDRCHLNGLAMVDGRPRYVTALGQTNTPGGWRANKASGGVLLDIESGEALVQGLSMPHSPRWYEDRLFILESGRGGVGWVDLEIAMRSEPTDRTPESVVHTICELPGFTRGVDFCGPLAFVGLSQVRDSSNFGGLPLVDRLGGERFCGVWVVHIGSGEVIGFMRFESGVEEIFAVQVLPGVRFPEMLEWDDIRTGRSYVVPGAEGGQTFWPT
jgi:uncharacterized protein (TIGR03032 family)